MKTKIKSIVYENGYYIGGKMYHHRCSGGLWNLRSDDGTTSINLCIPASKSSKWVEEHVTQMIKAGKL